MKRYLFIFISIFIFSTFISTIYFLSKNNNSLKNSSNNSLETIENIPNNISDFTKSEIETSEEQVITSPPSFAMPISSNEIGMKFSNEQLIYSKTLGEWTLHTGVDIVAKQGSSVLASEAGRVIEISSTIKDGDKIVIAHKDGYQTMYCNLSTVHLVQEGQNVEKGQIISSIGKTSTFEYNEKDHLHFEIYKDEIPLNPLNLID